MNRWRTTANGQIEVNGAVPLLAAAARQAFRLRVIDRWGETARRAATAAGIPWAWVVGIIWAESGGDPTATSPVGAAGLMQLYSAEARGGRSAAELKADPDLNVRLGARYLATIRSSGDTLVEVASKYNAGQTRDGRPHAGGEPWGYRENAGYISRVVAATNTALDAAPTRAPGIIPGLAPKPGFGVSPIVLVLTALRWLHDEWRA